MIRLDAVSRTFRLGGEDVHALDEVTIDVAAGEYVSVMGPSGSGKSTLLNMVALLDQPDAGTVFIDQIDVTQLADDDVAQVRGEKIGFVFQFFHLINRLTAQENIEIPLVLAGISPGEREARVAQTVQAYGLSDRAGHRPDQLSGGQRQRVAIARATIMQPTILLADEPTGNLDQASGRQIVELLESLNQQGMTLLIVTHDLELGERARRHVRMIDGRIAADKRTN